MKSKMRRICFLPIFLFAIILLLSPFLILASENTKKDSTFQAVVVEVLEQRYNELPDGSIVKQQNLKLRGLEGNFKNKEIIFQGIDSFDVAKKNFYKENEKVIVVASYDAEGNVNFYVTDYVRTSSVWYLIGLFVLLVLIIGKKKGFRALLSLVLTFVVVLKYIIPKILAGSSPVAVTILGSFVILLIIIYLTEGFKRKSHIAVASILISLLVTILLSSFFIKFAKLSGMLGEEVFYLINIAGQSINFQGLLLAGMIIGCLGALDDVVIAQVATVEQLVKTDPLQNKKELFKKAYKVGVSHISSMTNTLFLAYAGASIPLLILFASGESVFSSWTQIINNEMIATEIVRAMVGSIGLVLSIPIATWLAVWKMER